jgi:hypothetical protein
VEAPVDKPRKLRVKASALGEGVYVHPNGMIRIVSGDVEIHITPRPDAAHDLAAFAVRPDDWFTPEQEELRKVGRKMAAGGKFVAQLGINEEQVARARQLRVNTDLILTDADQAALLEQFQAWQETRGAAHREAQRALLATAKDIGDRSIEATKQAIFTDLERVREILTPEQWKQSQELHAAKR